MSVFAMDQCPVELGSNDYLEKVAKVITDADSCYAASDLAEACALGSSGDVYTVGAAIARCKKDMPVMSKDDAKMYKALNKKCGAKYSKLDGTMYRSMNAFCVLDVTKLFFDLLTPAE
jgi:hypothetical protein